MLSQCRLTLEFISLKAQSSFLPTRKQITLSFNQNYEQFFQEIQSQAKSNSIQCFQILIAASGNIKLSEANFSSFVKITVTNRAYRFLNIKEYDPFQIAFWDSREIHEAYFDQEQAASLQSEQQSNEEAQQQIVGQIQLNEWMSNRDKVMRELKIREGEIEPQPQFPIRGGTQPLFSGIESLQILLDLGILKERDDDDDDNGQQSIETQQLVSVIAQKLASLS